MLIPKNWSDKIPEFGAGICSFEQALEAAGQAPQYFRDHLWFLTNTGTPEDAQADGTFTYSQEEACKSLLCVIKSKIDVLAHEPASQEHVKEFMRISAFCLYVQAIEAGCI